MRFTPQAAIYVLGIVAFGAVQAAPASAGIFDIFKAKPNANSSGRQLVAFTPGAQPGTIVVSFADRKL
jgi:hypothetical protein